MRSVSIALPLYRPDPAHLIDAVGRANACRSVGEIVISDDDPAHSARIGLTEILQTSALPIRYQANRTPLGMAENWNAAVAMTTSPLVTLHCQDDRLIPDAYDALLMRFAAAGCPIAVGRYRNFGAARRQRRRFGDGSAVSHREPPSTVIRVALEHGNVYGFPASTVFSRDLWERIGGFRADYEHMADLEFVMRATLASGALFVHPTAITERRVHDANLTHEHVVSGAPGRDRVRLLAEYGRYLPSRRDRRRVTAMVGMRAGLDAMRHLFAGRPDAAAASLHDGLHYCSKAPSALAWASRSLLGEQRARTS